MSKPNDRRYLIVNTAVALSERVNLPKTGYKFRQVVDCLGDAQRPVAEFFLYSEIVIRRFTNNSGGGIEDAITLQNPFLHVWSFCGQHVNGYLIIRFGILLVKLSQRICRLLQI